MLKKAKLFSLLLVIVASTAIGLFGFSQPVFAADPGCENKDPNVVTFLGDKTDSAGGYHGQLCYKGNNYSYIGSAAALIQGQNEDSKAADGSDGLANSTCGTAPLIYEHINDVPDANGNISGSHIICFASSGTQGTFIWFPNAESFGPRQSGNYTYGVGTDEATVTLAEGTEAVDIGAAQNQFETDTEALPPTNEESVAEEPSDCQIPGGTGWIVCPVVHFFAAITDSSYYLLDKFLLKLEPIALPGAPEGEMEIYNAWKLMRDFANICFIIAFMIIVFSQLTSVGINNYGIKKLLPKIVIAVILVNVSFYICAIAVDLSNIIGNSLRGLLDSLNASGNPESTISFEHIPKDETQEEVSVRSWQDLVQIVLAGVVVAPGAAYASYVFISLLLPVLLGAALAVVTVVIALTLRQALIVILIVISPLAFVALLLPNTEGYFQKWKSLFIVMLAVYPAVSLVFGASAMASRILMGSNDFPTQIVGAGVSVIPLFITPIIMKVSGGLLNRWVGLVNNPNRGPVDALKKRTDSYAGRIDNRRRAEAMTGDGGGRRFIGGRYRSTAQREAIDAGAKAEADRASNLHIASEMNKNPEFAAAVAGTSNLAAIERAQARAQSTVERAEDEDVKAAHSTVDNMDEKAILSALSRGEGSDAKIAAMLERLVSISDAKTIEPLADRYLSGGEQNVITRSFAGALAKDGPQFLKGSDIDNYSRGKPTEGKTFREIASNNLANNVMSEEKMVSENNGNLDYAEEVAKERTAAGDDSAEKNLQTTANKLLANEVLRGKIKHNAGRIVRIAGTPPPPPRTPPPKGDGMRSDDV